MKNLIRHAKLNRMIKAPVIRVRSGIATATDHETWVHTPCDIPDGVYSLRDIELYAATGNIPEPDHNAYFVDEPSHDVAHSHTITVNVADIKRSAHSMAVKDIRYYLNGVCFDLSAGNIATTDGHRLSLVERAFEPIPGAGQIIVPRETIAQILKQGAKSATVSITVDYVQGAACIVSARAIHTPGITAILIDGMFPDYRRAVPLREMRQIIGSGDLLGVVSEAVKISKAVKSKWLSINITPAGCYCEGIFTAANFSLPGNSGISCNASYLLDAIKAAPGAEVRTGENEHDSFLFVHGNFIQVVMPMRGDVKNPPPRNKPASVQGVEPRITEQGVEPRITEQGVEPRITEQGVEPRITEQGVEPRITEQGVEPRITEQGVEPRITEQGVEPQASVQSVEPRITEQGVEPRITEQGVEPVDKIVDNFSTELSIYEGCSDAAQNFSRKRISENANIREFDPSANSGIGFDHPPAQVWHLISEELPEVNQAVVLINVNEWENAQHARNVQCAGYLSDCGLYKYWHVLGYRAGCDLESFTHWLALPDPPGERPSGM